MALTLKHKRCAGWRNKAPCILPEKRRATGPLYFVTLLQPCNHAEIFQSCRVAFDFAVVASSRSKRRMILPLRVLGSMSVKSISSGLASPPISFATHWRSSSLSWGTGSSSMLERDERGNGLTFKLIRTPYHRSLGHGFMRHQCRLHFHGAKAVAADVEYIVHPPHDPEISIFIFIFARPITGPHRFERALPGAQQL
jgi:hypothetical protein